MQGSQQRRRQAGAGDGGASPPTRCHRALGGPPLLPGIAQRPRSARAGCAAPKCQHAARMAAPPVLQAAAGAVPVRLHAPAARQGRPLHPAGRAPDGSRRAARPLLSAPAVLAGRQEAACSAGPPCKRLPERITCKQAHPSSPVSGKREGCAAFPHHSSKEAEPGPGQGFGVRQAGPAPCKCQPGHPPHLVGLEAHCDGVSSIPRA